MADITKLLNRIIPPQARTLTVSGSDVSSGDVFMVEESMGRPASKIFVDAEDYVALRLNVYHMVFPRRDGRDLMTTAHLPNLALGGRIKDGTMALVELAPGETFELDETPISDIEFHTVSGNFTLLLA